VSNYYKSKCCGEQVNYTAEIKTGTKVGDYYCNKCNQKCEVTAMLDTPSGVPTADESVQQYQEDIEAGVDVGESTHNLCKSTHNLGNLPKTKELKRHICRFNDGEQSCTCFIKGQEAENKAWLKGERCHSCGKYMKPSATTNTCPRCWEEQ
jgi:hypothetical protein